MKNATSFHGLNFFLLDNYVINSIFYLGCLSNIHVNGQLKNLQTEVLSSNGTTVGCAQTIDLCIGVECGGGNGKCHLNSSLPDGFECKCRDEFDGKNCEKRIL